MKERPILLSGEMIRATLDDRKSQTRRVIHPRKPWLTQCAWYGPHPGGGWWGSDVDPYQAGINPGAARGFDCPYGEIGDRLWVRETAYIAPPKFGDIADCNCRDNDGQPRLVGYVASMDGESVRCAEEYGVKITPSIFMPRWANRILLEITDIRVQRIQDISQEEAIAEGIERINDQPYWAWKDYTGNGQRLSPLFSFQSLWDTINADRGYPWDSNPWVWVIGFRRIKNPEVQK